MADELLPFKQEDISTKLVTSQISPRSMLWFLVNEGELEDFEKVDSESSQFLTVGIAAIATAIGLFGSSFTISSAFTLAQLVAFYLTPGVVGTIGTLSIIKGLVDRSNASQKREKDIKRIKKQSAVTVETTARIVSGVALPSVADDKKQ